jgi:hypothetical protein
MVFALMFALIVGIPILLLVAAMVRIDLRARRQGRRLRVRQADVRQARRDTAARAAQEQPGGNHPGLQGPFIGPG